MKIKTTELFDLKHTLAQEYLESFEYPWLALSGIKDLIISLFPRLKNLGYKEVAETIWVHESSKVFESAYLGPYTIIGLESEIRHCAFIRGCALVGSNCVIGNSVELKNSIIFNNCEVPHFNYVGDSILGYKSHMGAGSITSNIKSDKKNIVIHAKEDIETGLRKIGAMLGDYVEIGCNTVLNPGTIIGRNTNVYPCSCVRGVVAENCIYKNSNEIVSKVMMFN